MASAGLASASGAGSAGKKLKAGSDPESVHVMQGA